MRLSNVRFIRAEDFPKESQQTITLLAPVINEFMRQSVDIINGRLSFENREEVLKKIRIRVDATGTPIGTSTINIEKNTYNGMQIINVQNLSSSGTYPSSQPFVSAEKIAGNQAVIKNISGLAADNDYILTVVIY